MTAAGEWVASAATVLGDGDPAESVTAQLAALLQAHGTAAVLTALEDAVDAARDHVDGADGEIVVCEADVLALESLAVHIQRAREVVSPRQAVTP